MTESELSATAHEFHSLVGNETETQDQVGNAPQAQDRSAEESVMKQKHQMYEEKVQEDPEAEEGGDRDSQKVPTDSEAKRCL